MAWASRWAGRGLVPLSSPRKEGAGTESQNLSRREGKTAQHFLFFRGSRFLRSTIQP